MFSQNLKFVLDRAMTFAKTDGHEYLTLEHLLFVLSLEDEQVKELLKDLAEDLSEMQSNLFHYIKKHVKGLSGGSKPPQKPKPTRAFNKALQGAVLQVQSSDQNRPIEGLDVLVAMFAEQDVYAVYMLKKHGVSRLKVITWISNKKRQETDGEDGDSPLDDHNPLEELLSPLRSQKRKDKDVLNDFATNLNTRAKKGKTDPLIGRSDEIERLIQILCRRRKNNPLLVGDPGVGKTAIAEGLAWLIVQGKVPELLKDHEIYSLDVGALVAGTKYRGDFEKRVKKILDKVKKNPKIILFIDEIHMIIGAGSSASSNEDIANLIKPALANGELRCIGSTTFTEYRQVFDGDAALSRRFQKIDVTEPSIEDSIQILHGLKSHYEKFHKVAYTDEALASAVTLSAKHLHERFLPDKAIDVIDEAGAYTRLMRAKNKQQQSDETPQNLSDFKDKKIKKDKAYKEKHARTHQKFKDSSLDSADTVEMVETVDVAQIEAVIAKMARIPAQSVSKDDKTLLKNLEPNLKQQIFGQDTAIDALVGTMKLARAGLRSPDKPIGCFLFAGPTGVGKTEVSRQLAEQLDIPLVRFDMSEYMEAHTASRLIGAPPGYVGYDKGGLLTEKISQNPHCVLLLDEIEKAHPDVFNLLLQVMDHGTLTDNNGRAANFKQVILIMTTNVGADSISRASMGFTKQDHSKDNTQAIKRAFTPEFRNRLDTIIHFNALDEHMIASVVDKFLIELQTQLKDKKVTLKIDDPVRQYLAKKGSDRLMGARPMQRVIQDEIKKPLAEMILFGELEHGGVVKISLDLDKDENTESKITFSVIESLVQNNAKETTF